MYIHTYVGIICKQRSNSTSNQHVELQTENNGNYNLFELCYIVDTQSTHNSAMYVRLSLSEQKPA